MIDFLGKTVKDVTSGLTGIVTTKSDWLSGTTQFVVQPEGDGKTMPDSYSIDSQSLVLVEDGATIAVTPADDTVKIALGNKVECVITGFAGIVTKMSTFINGCVYAEVTPRFGPHPKMDDNPTLFTVHSRLKIVDESAWNRLKATAAAGVAAIAAAVTPEAQAAPVKPPGGPSMRAMRPS